ncbi:uncharacterized protein C8Q71DRAFT_488529 [Rhodofomes roseus]|uniref:Uncharacterized protein n=1 Tax=Rhodofomes roseus TaxID=34475 RepID=A0ABQ8KKZ2_9APHY|nr:uncharacterized protein C8Q71DRAFT_488529 [Rhodofomes roseus]KAH9838979.1 hypothetical protein C8Q71DRAFT_488529 [Rhodofomes roseus]
MSRSRSSATFRALSPRRPSERCCVLTYPQSSVALCYCCSTSRSLRRSCLDHFCEDLASIAFSVVWTLLRRIRPDHGFCAAHQRHPRHHLRRRTRKHARRTSSPCRCLGSAGRCVGWTRRSMSICPTVRITINKPHTARTQGPSSKQPKTFGRSPSRSDAPHPRHLEEPSPPAPPPDTHRLDRPRRPAL